MNDRNKKINISLEWNKALLTLKEAEVLEKAKMAEGAISRAYYAALHAAKALILTEGLEAKSHEGIGRLFSLHFIKTKKMQVKFSHIFSHAQKDREEADYFSEYVFTQQDAQVRIKEIKEFLLHTEELLKADNFID